MNTNIDTDHDADALSVVLSDIAPDSVYCEDYGSTVRVCELGTDETLLTIPASLLKGDLQELATEILRLLRSSREERDSLYELIVATEKSERAGNNYAEALLHWNAVISK